MSAYGYKRTSGGLGQRVRFAPESGHSVEYAVQQVGSENQCFPYPVGAPRFHLCS